MPPTTLNSEEPLMHRLALGAFQQLKKYYYQIMLYGS